MKYDYVMVLRNDNIDVHTGTIDARDPRNAAESIVREHTDWIDEVFANLNPSIEVWRQGDHSHQAEVDSHGLGEASILIEQVA